MTEEAFAEAAMTYARGDIGSPQGEMSGLTAEQMDEFTNANIIKKVTKNEQSCLQFCIACVCPSYRHSVYVTPVLHTFINT